MYCQPQFIGSAQTIHVTAVRVPTPLDIWRFNNFGTYAATGPAANNADPDGDRVPNLVEYVMNRDPNGVALINPGAPPVVVTYNGQLRAEITLLDNYDSKVRLTLQVSADLQNWTPLSTRTGTGAWSITPTTTALPAFSLTRFNFVTGATSATRAKYYVRLKAEELP